MFGKRPVGKRDETSLEEILLDLEIRGALLAEYGRVAPPAGIFQRVMRKIRARESSIIARAHARIVKPIFGLTRAFYGKLRHVASGAMAGRLMPAAMALILLVVVTDLNVQHLSSSTKPLQFISNGNQAGQVQDSSAVSLTSGTVDSGWYEPDPDIRHPPRSREPERTQRTDQGNQQSKSTEEEAQSTPAPRSYSEEQMYLTSGPY
ncbi:MAG TPA: hypothetical protein VF952_10240 [Chloroflexia bacterium]